MRQLLFAAALSISGIALAQTVRTDPNGPNAPPGDGVTQQGTVPSGAATPPPGANEPLDPPPGAIVMPPPNPPGTFTPQTPKTDYPTCSKTVTDRCIQAYERGVRRGRRR